MFFEPKSNPALARLEVRKALSLAVDRDHIVHDLLGGYATALMGPVPPGSGIREPALPATSTRIDDAKAVLMSAGWTYDADTQAWENAKAKLTLSSLTIRTSDAPN